jgi:hypothetical protein
MRKASDMNPKSKTDDVSTMDSESSQTKMPEMKESSAPDLKSFFKEFYRLAKQGPLSEFQPDIAEYMTRIESHAVLTPQELLDIIVTIKVEAIHDFYLKGRDQNKQIRPRGECLIRGAFCASCGELIATINAKKEVFGPAYQAVQNAIHYNHRCRKFA